MRAVMKSILTAFALFTTVSAATGAKAADRNCSSYATEAARADCMAALQPQVDNLVARTYLVVKSKLSAELLAADEKRYRERRSACWDRSCSAAVAQERMHQMAGFLLYDTAIPIYKLTKSTGTLFQKAGRVRMWHREFRSNDGTEENYYAVERDEMPLALCSRDAGRIKCNSLIPGLGDFFLTEAGEVAPP
jgi:uncharacterized protein